MADNLPIMFDIPGEPALANYNAEDLADGTGIIEFDGFQSTVTGPTISYILSTNAIVSDPAYYHIQNQSTSSSTTMNFDSSPLNSPRTIKGTVKIAFTHGASNTTGLGTNYIACGLYKWDGATETQIGSTVTSPTIVAVGSSSVYNTRLLTISAPLTILKVGEMIRLKVVMTYTGATGNVHQYFFTDPTNAIIGSEITNITFFKVAIPFRIPL